LLPERETRPLVGAAVALAAGLVAVVWLGSRATRHELMTLLREQAASLRQTVAAAARSNQQAAREVQAQLAARLLDNARLLAELDRRGGLDPAALEEIARRHGLFRVAVYAADGSPELAAAGPARPGRGHGGRGPGNLLPRLIDAGEAEATTELHSSRWGGARMAAGVRRHGGGAIVLNIDATAAAALERQLSLDTLLADIARSTPGVAYVVFHQGAVRIAHGRAPPEEPAGPERDGEVQRVVEGRPILELEGPVELGEETPALLRLGLRLDGVRQAERRMLWQLAFSLAVSLALAAAGIGTLWLRRSYGRLSERHARAEVELRRRDRLAAMGELASGVAHEIRNPLNAIAMTSRRLRSEFRHAALGASERDEQDELLEVLESQTRRIDATVQQFLEYARPKPLAARAADAGRLIAEAGEAARALAESRGVELAVAAEAVGEATLDPDQLRQALDNLLRNAIEAAEAGGRVLLAARRQGSALVVEVSDTGAGIAPEHLPRIFDLYFTTKPGGTGVGLAVTQQIVSAHGGSLDVDSRPGEGTLFTLRLPLQREAPR
jgi:signal transduction histidine kinase